MKPSKKKNLTEVESLTERKPEPSHVSMKSDHHPPVKFRKQDCPTKLSLIERKPEPSHVSMKSDKSIGHLPDNFRKQNCPTELSLIERKPEPSHVSMKSDQSMDHQIIFRKQDCSTELSLIERKPEPSHVSMKSDVSIVRSITFRKQDCSTELSLIERKPEPSHVSMKSNQSMDRPPGLQDCSTKLSLIERKPEPSHVSMKSDVSMEHPWWTFRKQDCPTELRVQEETLEATSRKMDSLFKEMEHKVISLVKTQLKKFVKLLSHDYPVCSEREMEDEEDQSVRDATLKLTLHVLRIMSQTDLANMLQTKLAPSCHHKLKSTLREKFQKMNEGISNHGNAILLNDIYTELYVTKGESGEVNNEHEVRQIETASRRRAAEETAIKCNDIFKDKAIRSVLTKGVAGIGKTVSVQKFVLDWAGGEANQDVLFVFPLPFRELNLMKEKNLSLLSLLHHFFADTKELKPREYYHYKTIFVLDGLDECRLPLDFQSNRSLFDLTEPASLDVLLTNLIKGNLLPSALVWITTRPAAASKIPPGCINQVTEVRGFSDPQKEEYFRKRIRDQGLAERIITHIKSSRSLHIMCHIPVFCWIAATVLERMLGDAGNGEVPKTLTQMFTQFLVFQVNHSNRKYHRPKDIDRNQTRKVIMALGKLAFQELEKGNLIFYEEDLRACGIDVKEMSVWTGVCTQIFREEFGLHAGKVFTFVHLSVQEFLAALYAFLSAVSSNSNALLQQAPVLFGFLGKPSMSEFLRSAVDKALQSENGHLDLFLRFLLGLSLESNQTLLRGTLAGPKNSSYRKTNIARYVKEKIWETPSPEKTIFLLHCLNELNDHSVVHEVQTYLNRRGPRGLSGAKLSPAQWSAVAFAMLNSEEELDEFDLGKFEKSEECFLRLLPFIKACRKVMLCDCKLTEKSCAALALALSSDSSSLRELDMSYSELMQDLGVKLLSAGLEHPHCKLETLELSNCSIGKEGCATLLSALKSNPSHLKQLNLNWNKPGNSGMKLLFNLLQDPQCKLEKLHLFGCGLTRRSCAVLSAVLSLTSCCLRELNLGNNELQDSGVKLLAAGLANPHCKLEKLWLCNCGIGEEGCAALVSALKSNPSHLQELNLNSNKPGGSDRNLSALLKDPRCKLEKLHF